MIAFCGPDDTNCQFDSAAVAAANSSNWIPAWANNEIGSLNDIAGLADIAHRHGVLIHVDGTQVIGKLPVNLQEVPADFLSLSAHKLHGPKGIGAAFIRGDDYGLPPMSSYMHGGEQERGLRAGTLAVHNIVGFGKAAELAFHNTRQLLPGASFLQSP